MKIERKQDGNKGLFYIMANDVKVAEMIYSIKDERLMVIEHTEVDDSLRGKNIGLALVEAGAALAREKNYKILALCPFAKKVMERNRSKYTDVLQD
jgi:predicted GNAT family acetyltransferase